MRLTEDEIVASLPPWTTQITLRACVVGVVLGVLFQFITMRFALGPGGVVPTFNMPMGAPSRSVAMPACLRASCSIGATRAVHCFRPCVYAMFRCQHATQRLRLAIHPSTLWLYSMLPRCRVQLVSGCGA